MMIQLQVLYIDILQDSVNIKLSIRFFYFCFSNSSTREYHYINPF